MVNGSNILASKKFVESLNAIYIFLILHLFYHPILKFPFTAKLLERVI